MSFDMMGKQALQPKTRQDLKDILLGPAQLYEMLRAKGAGSGGAGLSA